MSVSAISTLDTTYTVRLDEASATVTYVGEGAINSVESNPVWRIRKLTTTGSVLAIQWADGNQNFDNVWTDRASLTYT